MPRRDRRILMSDYGREEKSTELPVLPSLRNAESVARSVPRDRRATTAIRVEKFPVHCAGNSWAKCSDFLRIFYKCTYKDTNHCINKMLTANCRSANICHNDQMAYNTLSSNEWWSWIKGSTQTNNQNTWCIPTDTSAPQGSCEEIISSFSSHLNLSFARQHS